VGQQRISMTARGIEVRSKPGRFRLTVKLLKLLDIGIEVETQHTPDELAGTNRARHSEGDTLRHESAPYRRR
jgi:hypothetical protein